MLCISIGFGNHLVRHLDNIGVLTFAGCLSTENESSRRLADETSERVHLLQLDVTNDQQVADSKKYINNIIKKKKIGEFYIVYTKSHNCIICKLCILYGV